MNQVHDVDVQNAKQRLAEIRAELTRQDEVIAAARNNGANSYMAGKSLMGTAQELQDALLSRDVLKRAEEMAAEEVKRLESARPVYADALKAAKEELQALEDDQEKNITDYFKCLGAAWEAALSAAVVCSRAGKLDSEFRNEMARRRTLYGLSYLSTIEKVIAEIEVNQPDLFKLSELPTRGERYQRTAEYNLYLGGLI